MDYQVQPSSHCSALLTTTPTAGTAIIAGAGLVNALEIGGKNIEDIKVVVSGCGAAGFTCARHFIRLGVKPENLIATDVNGVVHQGRADLVADPSLYLNEIATTSKARSLAEAMEGADVFTVTPTPTAL